MDLLTLDAMILLTAEAARKAGYTPDAYLERYFQGSGRMVQAKESLWLLELTWEDREKIPVWDSEWSLDAQFRTVLKWKQED